MDKYGVEADKPVPLDTKEASSRDTVKCPVCGSELLPDLHVKMCPNCGSLPFEAKT